jgi:prepilin-type N-terminal cleavage/methylation domain-containing protein
MISMRVNAASHAESNVGSRQFAAFTLIEIMVVVAIIGMIMAMGVPTLYHMLRREGFGKTVTDVMELCGTARAQAILRGVTTEVVFHPGERRCELGAGVEENAVQTGAAKGFARTVVFGDDLSIDMLDVNLLEYRNAPIARVRFFPNGTSDEMTLILHAGREWRKISLEITTGLASLDSDPSRWR